MRNILQKYPWVILVWLALIWSAISLLIGFGPLRECFSFGGGGCATSGATLILFPISLPFLAGFILAWTLPYDMTAFFVGSLASSLLIIFIGWFLIRVIRNIVTRKNQKLNISHDYPLTSSEKFTMRFLIISLIGIIFLGLAWSLWNGFADEKKSAEATAKNIEQREIDKTEIKKQGIFYATYFPPNMDINTEPQEVPFKGYGMNIRYNSLSKKQHTIIELSQRKVTQWGRPLSSFYSEPPVNESFFVSLEGVTLANGNEAIFVKRNDNLINLYLDKDEWRIDITLDGGSKEEIIKIAESLKKYE